MQRLERVSIVVVMAFIFLIALTSLGFAQTAVAPGTTTMPGTMNPNTQIGPGLGQPGVTPPSPNLGQMPSTTLPSVSPNVTPNSTLPNSIPPNSTLPNSIPNINPNVNSNTFPSTPNQNIPSPNISPTPAPNATNPNLSPGVTSPNTLGNQTPYGTGVQGLGGGGVGTGTGTYGTYGGRGR
jgi:hypothetical protein